jgi:hypothetical protein
MEWSGRMARLVLTPMPSTDLGKNKQDWLTRHEFNAWLERNELSLAAAAKALGITRRTIIYYHGGYKPIPHYIKLACIGWETVTLQKAA